MDTHVQKPLSLPDIEVCAVHCWVMRRMGIQEGDMLLKSWF